MCDTEDGSMLHPVSVFVCVTEEGCAGGGGDDGREP